MGRRWPTAVQATLVLTLVGDVWAWISVRAMPDPALGTMVVALATPVVAATLLLSLQVILPSFGSETIDRPSTWTIPACHVGLTMMVAKAVLTGPFAIEAAPSALDGAVIWLNPTSLLVLFAFSVGGLELLRTAILRKPRVGPVS